MRRAGKSGVGCYYCPGRGELCVLGRPRRLYEPAEHQHETEQEHLARFLQTARDYARKQGFKGTFFIEPKPCEPTKHQYDFDAATVISFLRQYDLLKDFKLNLEVNHPPCRHTFQHELQVAADAGLLGFY